MLLNEYIERFSLHGYPVFSETDQVETAQHVLTVQGRNCAPVLREGKPVSLVTLSLLLAAREGGMPAMPAALSDLPLPRIAVAGPHEHLLDVFSRASSAPGDIIAIVDEGGLFSAVIEKCRLAKEISTLFHLAAGECVTLELEVPPSGVRISEVLSVFEKNDASVPAYGFRTPSVEGEGVILCFRVQTADLFRLVTNLEKYGYRVRYTTPFPGSGEDELREKALEFIRYLDM
ncbi:MAG: CBS domain-containing protein [Chlorobi bacterium]|nr:CBS domain-containing protein [Chlorobiota bacterium]